MSDALTAAFSDCQRSYSRAAQSVAARIEGFLASGPAGLADRPDLANAEEQLRHFRGWVYASIRPIAQRIAGQPIHVGRIVTDGLPRGSKELQFHLRNSLPGRLKGMAARIEPLVAHPIRDLLADPNDLMVAWSLMYSAVASLELTGRALWWVAERGKKRTVFPIPTSWLVGFEGTSRFTGFRIRPAGSGEPLTLPADEVVYFAYPDPSDPHGAISPLQATAAAVCSDEAIQAAQHSAFANGIHPVHVLKAGRLPGSGGQPGMRPILTTEQRGQLIDSMRRLYEGIHNRNEPFIVDGLIEEITRLSNTPEEMDFLDSAKATKARITQAFGTNPIIMGEIDGANRASAVVADQHFCDQTVNPKIELLSQCMTEWLGPIFAQNDERLVVWIEPCVPNDVEQELRRIELLAKHKLATVNELRAMAGLPEAPQTMAGELPPAAGDRFADVISNSVNEQLAGLGIDALLGR